MYISLKIFIYQLSYVNTAITSQHCPNTLYAYFHATGKCYRIFSDYEYWDEAQLRCRVDNLQANLALPESFEENSFVKQLMKKYRICMLYLLLKLIY